MFLLSDLFSSTMWCFIFILITSSKLHYCGKKKYKLTKQLTHYSFTFCAFICVSTLYFHHCASRFSPCNPKSFLSCQCNSTLELQKTPQGTSGLFIVALWSFLGDFRVQKWGIRQPSLQTLRLRFRERKKERERRGDKSGGDREMTEKAETERGRECLREAGLWAERRQRMREDWRLMRGNWKGEDWDRKRDGGGAKLAMH